MKGEGETGRKREQEGNREDAGKDKRMREALEGRKGIGRHRDKPV